MKRLILIILFLLIAFSTSGYAAFYQCYWQGNNTGINISSGISINSGENLRCNNTAAFTLANVSINSTGNLTFDNFNLTFNSTSTADSIYISQSSGYLIINNSNITFRGFKTTGCYTATSTNYIQASSANITINNSNISAANSTVNFDFRINNSKLVMRNNEIAGSTSIAIDNTNNSIITGNNIHHGVSGVNITYSNNASIQFGYIHDNSENGVDISYFNNSYGINGINFTNNSYGTVGYDIYVIYGSNLTIRNITSSNSYNGIEIIYGNNVSTYNASYYNNIATAINYVLTNNSEIKDVYSTLSASRELFLDRSDYIKVTNFTAYGSGLSIESTTNSIIDNLNDTMYKLTGVTPIGIDMRLGVNITIKNSYIWNSSEEGIYVQGWANGSLVNTTIKSCKFGVGSIAAGYVDLNVTNNSFINNSFGLFIYGSINNNYTLNNLYNNTNAIWLGSLSSQPGSYNNNFINNTITGTSTYSPWNLSTVMTIEDVPYGVDWFSNQSSYNKVYNLTINKTILSFEDRDMIIREIKDSDVPENTTGLLKLDYSYLNITGTNSTDSWLFLNLSYNESKAINENRLRLFRHDGISWSYASSSVDTTNNYVYGNITTFSMFAVMEDDAAPVRSDGAPSGAIADSETIMSITTDENAVCRYSTDSNIAFSAMSHDTTLGTTHTWGLTGLMNGASYSYYIRCNDTYGNYNTNDYSINFTVSISGPPNGGGGIRPGQCTGDICPGVPISPVQPTPDPSHTADEVSADQVSVGQSFHLPAGGKTIKINDKIKLNIFGTNATLNNLTKIDPNEYKILFCNQSYVDAYEINVSVDNAYICFDTGGYDISALSIYKFKGEWNELENITKMGDKICGKITSTPYMIAGFKTSPDQQRSLEEITLAKDRITKLSKLTNVTESEELVKEAEKSYFECDYQTSFSLAQQAMQVTPISLPGISLLLWAPVAVILFGLYIFYKHKNIEDELRKIKEKIIKKKVTKVPQYPQRASKKQPNQGKRLSK